jgi:hypothetical protein
MRGGRDALVNSDWKGEQVVGRDEEGTKVVPRYVLDVGCGIGMGWILEAASRPGWEETQFVGSFSLAFSFVDIRLIYSGRRTGCGTVLDSGGDPTSSSRKSHHLCPIQLPPPSPLLLRGQPIRLRSDRTRRTGRPGAQVERSVGSSEQSLVARL